MTKTKIYKREIVHHPFRRWIEYYTDKTLADKAYETTDPSMGLYVHDAGVTETVDVDMYLYSHLEHADDYNNDPDVIRGKAVET